MATFIVIFNPITLLLIYIAYTKSDGWLKKLLTLVGAIIDLVVNATWFTVLFWQLPPKLTEWKDLKNWLLTQRVASLKSAGGYRGWLANLICKLLNKFEADHCV